MANDAETAALKALMNNPATPTVLHASKMPIPQEAETIALADIVECDFPGYAPIVLDDFDDTDNDYQEAGEALTSVREISSNNDLVAPQPICFLYVTHTPDGGARALMEIINLPEAIIINVPNQAVQFQVRALSVGLSGV